jgi:superfamily II DNA or RNA helicase
MIEIAFDNVWSYVRGPRDEVRVIADHLTFFTKGARYSLAYKQGRWDGKKSFFSARYQSFATGLLPEIIKKLKKENIEYKIGDRRDEKTSIEFKEPHLTVELRDHQHKSIEALFKYKRGICKLSTRSGKTVIGIACTQILAVPTLFVVHTKDLLHQTVREYQEKAHIDPGVIGEGTWSPSRVTVATIQSLGRALSSNPDAAIDFLESREFVIFDEVHRASETYQKVAYHLKSARYRLGLSATALISGKENKLASMAITGPLIYEVRMKELVDVGRIAKPKIYFVEIADQIWGEDWNMIYENGVVNHEERNMAIALIASRMYRKGMPSLILVEKLDHGKNIMNHIGDRIPVEYVSGSASSKKRADAILRLQAGDIGALISTRIFNEGIDIPYLESVIVASGYKSAIQSYQKYGRGITKVEKKDKTVIFDFFDMSHDLLWSHSEDRMSLCRRDEAFDVEKITMEKLLAESFWESV